MKKILYVLLFIFPALAFAQSDFAILCIAAHPDDEDGATLAYYSKLKGYKAYTIFYTRGEGGQNETGPELYDELGRLREQECYDAAAIQGSTAYFLGELDFGFSKTAKETFRFWGGEDSVLARIVYMIRILRPDVVISNHDTITTKPHRQHGHHQVSGITIYNAFDKAADPNYHPEQLTGGVTPWQIRKLFFRSFIDTSQTDVYHLDVFAKDASGKTIQQIAIDALSRHKTQGMDKIDKNSSFFTGNRRYALIRSDKMYPVSGDDLFEGLTPSEKPRFNVELKSYPTYYNYKTVNAEDSLRILKSIKYNPAAKIGLVKTYDNTIENVLQAFGISYDTISGYQLTGSLGKYSTIILDIRAYLYRPDLAEYNRNILDYIYHGGNVVCFYNKPGEWNNKNYSPYPIYLTNERVTEEDARVKTINPRHKLFYGPNKINNDIWDGWVQERNIYLPSDDTLKTSARYERLFEMNDENEPVPPTSLLYAYYGKGTYTYCSLALYRQLKIFNEGALKLFFNLIAEQANWDGGVR